MKLKLERIYFAPDYTIGKLYIDGKYYCDTLEDANRDKNKDGLFNNSEVKVYGNTCIPFGIYEVIITYSNHFKKELPLLLNVPSFEGVRIHAGNTIADTLGCILVGENKEKGKVINSKVYADKLNDLIKSEYKKNIKITIEIV